MALFLLYQSHLWRGKWFNLNQRLIHVCNFNYTKYKPKWAGLNDLTRAILGFAPQNQNLRLTEIWVDQFLGLSLKIKTLRISQQIKKIHTKITQLRNSFHSPPAPTYIHMTQTTTRWENYKINSLPTRWNSLDVVFNLFAVSMNNTRWISYLTRRKREHRQWPAK